MIGFDLLTASIGLAATALTAALLLPLWRRAPVPAYRLAVSVLAAALALPLLQAGARALDLPVPHPVRDLALRLADTTPDVLAPTAAEPLELWLTPEELEGLVFEEPLLASLDAAELPARPGPEPAPAPRAASPRVPWSSLLLALWAAGALWSLGRTLLRLRATRRLFEAAAPVEDPATLAVWDAVRAGSRLGPRTRLLQSSAVRSPACSGLVRPAVVLPADAGLERRPDLLACVLTHELVHLERRDPWVLVGEELLRATFWFHPAAWWLVARLAALRELSCDCLVVRRTGKRKRYASALVEYASWMQRPAPRATWAAVVPWSESRGHLTRRIEMLLQPQDSPRAGRVFAPAAVGVLMTFLWSGQLALATSSCAGTRAEHAHEHPHEHAEADAHTVHATHEGGEHDVRVVTLDGGHEVRGVVLGAEGEKGERVTWRVRGDGQGKVVSQNHVVVIQKDGGERTVYTGEDAKKWLAENGAAVKVHELDGSKTKNQWVEEIQDAWRDADGDHDVFVIRGADGKVVAKPKAKSKSKTWSWTTGDSEGDAGGEHEVEVIVSGPHGAHVERIQGGKAKGYFVERQDGQDGEQRVRVLLRDGDGEDHWLELDGGKKVMLLDGKRFDLDFTKGSKGELRFGGEDDVFFGKAKKGGDVEKEWFEADGNRVLLEGKGDLRFGGDGNVFFGKAEAKELHEKLLKLHATGKAKPHGDDHALDMTTLDELFEAKRAGGDDLESLRRELEKTRAALEQQRKMLEELKQQLEKQRAKARDAAAHFAR